MTNWKKYKLGETLLSANTGLDAIKRAPIVSQNTGKKCLRIQDISQSKKFENWGFTDVSDSNFLKFKLLKNDIIIARTGATVGVNMIISENLNSVFNNGLIRIRAKESFNSKFLYYHLRSKKFWEHINGIAFGTTSQPNIQINQLLEYKITAPDLPTQTAISEILSSLDDKIELNNKINQELEALAQTLFKQWFIDFDFPNENGEPYKSSGGEMLDSEIGEIPKGWVVYSMSDLLETVSKTYPLKTVQEIVFLNTGDIQDGKFLHNNISDPKTLPGQAKKSISINDILYSEIRPANKRFAFVHFDTSKYVVSTKLMVLRSKVEINSLFQYFILTQKEQIDYLQHLAESRSGTFPQITFSEVSTIKIALPSFGMVNMFVKNVLEPFFTSKFSSEYENQVLINLRDTLLPKLLSGEIEVAQGVLEKEN